MPKNKANMDIRTELFKNGITMEAFEAYCGWSHTTLNRTLAKELPQEKKDVLFEYIEKMKNGDAVVEKPWCGKSVGRPCKDPSAAATVFGSNVLAELNRRKIRIGDFAKQIGTTSHLLGNSLYHVCNHRIDFVVKCADALGMSVDALIGRDGYAE